MAPRQSISKGKRYAIFARDNFTCRYCGRQAGEVKLVVDHIVPVVQGGDNDPTNLITSCEDCNAGKGAKTPTGAVPTREDSRRIEQERIELQDAAAKVRAARQAREELLQQTVNILCELSERDTFDKRTAKIIAGYVEEFGPQLVIGWIEKACEKPYIIGSDSRIGRYVSGIRRSWLAQQELRPMVEQMEREEYLDAQDEYDAIRDRLDAEDEEREAILRARPRTPEQNNPNYIGQRISPAG